jgi:S1-C subfamily serine protease
MDRSSGNSAMQAGVFHAGNTCPYCQEIITEGQMIVACEKCGSLHHESCFRHNNGCASYHCEPRVRRDAGELHPELIVIASELEGVRVPPRPVRLSPQEAARPYLSPKPAVLSKLAVASLVLAILAAFGLAGVFLKSVPVLAAGIAVGIASIATGVVALVVINTGKKVHGFVPASVGIVLSAFIVMVFFGAISKFTRARAHNLAQDMEIAEHRLTDDDLRVMEPWRAHALRANVIIEASSPELISRAYSYGSGVILKIEDRKAFIVTNKHVIDADKSAGVHIVFYNGEESTARTEWQAPGRADLAVVSCQVLTVKDFEPTLVESALATQGARVFAVGNPLNLAWSYTEGVISSIREQREDGRNVAIYQTQTPINQGNSGGGLYDMTGRLIGINTWTKDKSIAEGLNFAISTRSLLDLLEPGEKERFLKVEP